MSSISSITEIVNISFVLGHVEEVQMNESSETETAFRHAQLVEEQRAKN